MNNKLLLNKTVSINDIQFLQFLHHDFDVVSDIYEYDNPCPAGIIYVGKTVEDLQSKLESITHSWIIVNNHKFDVDLTTNDGIIKNILPLQYIKLASRLKDKHSSVDKIMSYDECLDKVKICLINCAPFTVDEDNKTSVYELFRSILFPQTTFEKVYFETVTRENVNLIASSMLSILCRVQSKSVPRDKPHYARLITESNTRYGKYIKQAIYKYATSRAKKEVALFQLLSFLNKAQ